MDTFAQNMNTLLGHATVVTSQMAYLQIPTASLRQFMDSLGGNLAKLPYADSASGMFHRWREGHDLLVDVPVSFADPNKSGWKHLGHILITDFPTKAGIPIPGLSAGGLGKFLTETCGINKAWLSLNIMDAGIGIMAISEGASDLLAALSGEISLDAWTFFDTFGEGAIELWLGIEMSNPLLVISGSENILAGLTLFTQPVSWQINMMDVLGGALTGALIGIGVSTLLYKNKPPRIRAQLISNYAFRGIMMGGLGALSVWFSLGAASGFLLYTFGKNLANSGKRITAEMVYQTLRMARENPQFAKLWDDERMRLDAILHDLPLPEIKLPNSAALPKLPLPEIKLPNSAALPKLPLPPVNLPNLI